MPKYWFDHVHLTSPDALKTARFYEKMFQAKRVSVVEPARGGLRVELSLNGTTILITQRPPQPASSSPAASPEYGLIHFGFRTDNLEAAVAELKARGVEFRDDIKVVPPGFKISFFWAPENVAIELQE